MGIVARFVCACPGVIVIMGALLAAVSIWIVATRFNVVNNTDDLLSDKIASKRYYDELKRDFGSDYRFIVLIQSADPVQNRLAADEIGTYLETLKPQITTVLYKIDFSAIKPRLLFTRTPDELEQIAQQLESEVKAQKTSAEKTEQIALDLNSILSEANQKFDDKYLRKKENWTDFKPFVKQFVSILNKVAAQADGKTLAQEESKLSQDDNALDDFDANEMLAEHEYFSLQGGKAVLVFAYTGQEEKDSDAPFSNTTETIGIKL